MYKNRLKRYVGLISSTSLLVAFAIFALLANYYLDKNILQRDDFAVNRTAANGQILERHHDNEELPSEIYEHVELIRDGGLLINPNGTQWLKPAATDQRIIRAISNLENATNANDSEQFRNSYADFSSASSAVQTESLAKHKKLQYLAAAIIFFGLLGILAVVFFRLMKSDESVSSMTAESSHIMSAVNDGLFLIDEEYDIGQERSQAIKDIFGEAVDLNGNFFNFLQPFVNKEDLKLAEEYLELLFDGRVKKTLMTDLNPFQELEIDTIQKTGAALKKHISIGFSRSEGEVGKTRMLVSIKDISREVRLRDELETTKGLQKERMNSLMDVLRVDSTELNNFFDQSDRDLNEINTVLADETGDHGDNLAKLENIYRITHSLKGDAGALGLELFETSLQHFESKIQELKGVRYIDGQGMLGLAVQLKDTTTEIDLIRPLAAQVRMFAPATKSRNFDHDDSSASSVGDRLNMLAQRVAEREEKEVEIDCTGFTLLDDDEELKEAIFDIAVQLVRNSIVHGIEPPDERVQLGKKTFGTVSVLLSEVDNGNLQLIVRDDGRGLQFARIKQKAIEEGLLSQTASLAIEPKNLLKFIFMQGFSSADHPSVDAGRGVGLDVVKAKVNDISGKIGVRTSRKKYCQFKIFIPQETV